MLYISVSIMLLQLKHYSEKKKAKHRIETISRDDLFERGLFENLKFHNNSSKKILRLGTETVGTKGSDFLTKSYLIDTLSLKRTPKIVLANDLVELFTSGYYIGKSEFLAEKISHLFTEFPILAIRSSGLGDGKGVGIYETQFVVNHFERIIEAIEKVSQSNFTESAKQYRKRLGILDDQQGIIIEPCIGKEFQQGYFGPLLSGYGTSKSGSGSFEINIHLGLGGGVNDPCVLKITPEEVAMSSNTLLGNIIKESLSKNYRDNHLITGFLEKKDLQLDGINLENGEITQYSLPYNDEIYNFNVQKLIKKILNIQKITKTPHYFEFATATPSNASGTYITQLSNDNKINKSIERGEHGIQLSEMKHVLNTGKVVVDRYPRPYRRGSL